MSSWPTISSAPGSRGSSRRPPRPEKGHEDAAVAPLGAPLEPRRPGLLRADDGGGAGARAYRRPRALPALHLPAGGGALRGGGLRRSEERRVGKECRSRGATDAEKKKKRGQDRSDRW